MTTANLPSSTPDVPPVGAEPPPEAAAFNPQILFALEQLINGYGNRLQVSAKLRDGKAQVQVVGDIPPDDEREYSDRFREAGAAFFVTWQPSKEEATA